MVTAYPAALDTVGSQLRTDIASTDDLDDSGKEHDTQHVNVNGAVVALETKLGIGASAASAASDGDALTKQADGSTAWEAAAGASWSGSTANGLATYGDASTIVAESNATYDGTDLTLTSGNLVVSDGFGIDFSATSDAAGMTSELLDDYEEGEWTPTFTPGTSGTITPNTIFDTGGYIKIGRLVYLQGYVGFSAVSSPVGTLVIGGLPFTSATLTDRADRTAFWINYVNPSVDEGAGVYLSLADGASTMTLAVGNGNTAQYSANRAQYVDTGTGFNFNCTYYANA